MSIAAPEAIRTTKLSLKFNDALSAGLASVDAEASSEDNRARNQKAASRRLRLRHKELCANLRSDKGQLGQLGEVPGLKL